MNSLFDKNSIDTVRPAYPILQIPKSSLGYTANNQYSSYPPLMSDGRSVMSSWQPEAVINRNLLADTGITSNWQYRKYMIDNAEKIIKYNCAEACNDTGYFVQYVNPSNDQSFGTPKFYQYYQEPTIGQVSDLKQTYLTREQLAANSVSPVVTQDELLKLRFSK
jgi:hypothetical protein